MRVVSRFMMATGTKPSKILIVEDDALVALSLREVLNAVGFQVVGVASTVGDALCLAQDTRPDVAIFDVRLVGRRDGIEGAIQLRGILDIPVVFLTGEGDEGTRARARAASPSAFLFKPVDSRQIITAVRDALAKTDSRRGPAGAVEDS